MTRAAQRASSPAARAADGAVDADFSGPRGNACGIGRNNVRLPDATRPKT
jgi:hypothetical protein